MPKKRKNVEKVRQNGSFNPFRFRDGQSRIFYCLNTFLIAQNQPVNADNLMRIKAIEDARRDAKRDYNEWLTIGYGFCTGTCGLIYAYAEEPEIKTPRLMGKPPEYITIYSTEYYRIARRRQLGFTAIGCLMSGYIILQLSANSRN